MNSMAIPFPSTSSFIHHQISTKIDSISTKLDSMTETMVAKLDLLNRLLEFKLSSPTTNKPPPSITAAATSEFNLSYTQPAPNLQSEMLPPMQTPIPAHIPPSQLNLAHFTATNFSCEPDLANTSQKPSLTAPAPPPPPSPPSPTKLTISPPILATHFAIDQIRTTTTSTDEDIAPLPPSIIVYNTRAKPQLVISTPNRNHFVFDGHKGNSTLNLKVDSGNSYHQTLPSDNRSLLFNSIYFDGSDVLEEYHSESSNKADHFSHHSVKEEVPKFLLIERTVLNSSVDAIYWVNLAAFFTELSCPVQLVTHNELKKVPLEGRGVIALKLGSISDAHNGFDNIPEFVVRVVRDWSAFAIRWGSSGLIFESIEILECEIDSNFKSMTTSDVLMNVCIWLNSTRCTKTVLTPMVATGLVKGDAKEVKHILPMFLFIGFDSGFLLSLYTQLFGLISVMDFTRPCRKEILIAFSSGYFEVVEIKSSKEKGFATWVHMNGRCQIAAIVVQCNMAEIEYFAQNKDHTWDEGVSSNFPTAHIKDIFEGKIIMILGLPGTACLELYSKCECVEKSLQISKGLKVQDTTSWTSVMCALTMNGNTNLALVLFLEMKDRIAKLLFRQDMSRGMKGASTSLTISNTITNLYTSLIDKHQRLEALHSTSRMMWGTREMNYFFIKCDYMVEYVPVTASLPDGTPLELMIIGPKKSKAAAGAILQVQCQLHWFKGADKLILQQTKVWFKPPWPPPRKIRGKHSGMDFWLSWLRTRKTFYHRTLRTRFFEGEGNVTKRDGIG